MQCWKLRLMRDGSYDLFHWSLRCEISNRPQLALLVDASTMEASRTWMDLETEH